MKIVVITVAIILVGILATLAYLHWLHFQIQKELVIEEAEHITREGY